MPAAIDVLNAARVAAGYEDRIPEINQENLSNLSLLPPEDLNRFIDVIVKIVKQYVYDTTFDSSDNPFAAFYQEKLPVGASVEDMYLDLITGDVPAWDDDGSYALSKKLPSVKAIYHNQNYEMQYKVSTSFAQMKSAFLTEGGVNSLMNRIKGTLNSSAQYDLFLETLRLIATAFNNGAFTIKASYSLDSAAGIQAFLKDLKIAVKDMQFMNTKYNFYGYNTKTREDDIVIVTTPKVLATIDVDYLAGVFNMSKAEIKDRIIEVPDSYGFKGYASIFTDLTNSADIEIIALVLDRRMLRIFPTLFEGGAIYNPASLVDNSFLTLQYIFSYSLFMNAIAFCNFVPKGDTPPKRGIQVSWTNDTGADVSMIGDYYEEGNAIYGNDGSVLGVKVNNDTDLHVYVNVKRSIPGNPEVIVDSVEIKPGETKSVSFKTQYYYNARNGERGLANLSYIIDINNGEG